MCSKGNQIVGSNFKVADSKALGISKESQVLQKLMNFMYKKCV